MPCDQALNLRRSRRPGRSPDKTLVHHADNSGPVICGGGTHWYLQSASQGLGLQSLAADLGIQLNLRVLTDATAAIGIARRRGLGKVRHRATADLWVQDRLRKRDFSLEKIAGQDNPSDVLTKYVDRAMMVKHMERLGLHYESGRAESAPSIDG